MKNALKILMANFLVFIIVFGSMEAAIRIVNSFHPLFMDHKTFRMKQPSPYKNAEYFSREFVEESFRHPPGWKTPEGSNIVLPNDFKGKYFNTRNNIRATDGQPDSPAAPVIYLFGGSTMFCNEVPDKYTIASQLQNKLNESEYKGYKVENYGVTTVNSFQELERLRQTKLKKGDVVVFYDGVNEIIQGIFYNNPSETMVETFRQSLNRDPVLKVIYRLSKSSMFFRYIFKRTKERRSLPKHLTDAKSLNRIAGIVERNFLKNILEASRYCKNRDVAFLHILQPNIFTLERYSDYEKKLLQTQGITPIGIDVAFHKGNPFMKEVSFQLRNEGVNSVDATKIFNGFGEPVFLDFCHVNHVGNGAAAALIFSRLTESGLLKKKGDS